MSTSIQLGENLQTTCLHCGSVFRITPKQLETARGQARCNQCMQVFNALFSLENLSAQNDDPDSKKLTSLQKNSASAANFSSTKSEQLVRQQLSLNEAMYGDGAGSKSSLKSALWMVGILLLVFITVIQLIYYQRYSLVASSQYQQQILNLCQIMPCDESRFSNLSQIKLIERNVFSHPTRKNALMITGSFVNQASFSQAVPGLLISLSNIQGNLIANRLFKADEYLADKNLKRIPPGKPVQFHLEIFDPGSEALTYEFEFIS